MDEGRCRFNCRTGRMWFYAGYRQALGYEVPTEIMEPYYQEIKRKQNDRSEVARNDTLSSDGQE